MFILNSCKFILLILILMCFCVMLYVHINNFFSYVRTFPGLNQYLEQKIKGLAQGETLICNHSFRVKDSTTE